jgi:hypothetical protein
MTKGFLVFAFNNKSINYIEQAKFLSKNVKDKLNLPVSIVTDNSIDLDNCKNCFDKIIKLDYKHKVKNRPYRDGESFESLEFKNYCRSQSYALTPYDETIVIDTDVVLYNDVFKNCFSNVNNLLMYDECFPLSGLKEYQDYKYINDKGIKFYWATVIFFRKCIENEIFFNLVAHVEEYWNHYKNLFGISQTFFRNDFAFSIAIHIINGYKQGSFVNKMPGKLFYITDRESCFKLNDNYATFLIEKEKNNSNLYFANVSNLNVHIMNKFSLERCICGN